MIKNIIPVRHINSTGGTFITRLTEYAYANKSMPRNFSTYGNAHNIRDLFPIPKNFFTLNNDSEKQELISISKSLPVDKIYFMHLHSYLPYEKDFFYKWINITYNVQSIAKLLKVFNYKWMIDCAPSAKEQKATLKGQYIFYIKRQKFHSFIDDINICNIDWETEILGNPEQLIDKLSIFTKIDKNNFDLETLIIWQNMTKALFDKTI